MQNLNSLPGDNLNLSPLDPLKKDIILPDQDDDLKLPDQDSALFDTYKQASTYDPDIVAKVGKYSKQLNEDPIFVEKNLTGLEKVINSPDSSYWNDYEKRFPKSAEFLKDQKNMAMAQDDFNNLAQVEELVQDKSFSSKAYDVLSSGLNMIGSGVAKAPALIYEVQNYKRNLAYELFGREDLVKKASDSALNNPVAKYFDENSKRIAARVPELSANTLQSIEDGDLGKASEELALQFLHNAPQMAASIGISFVASPVAGSLFSGGLSAAESNAQSREKGTSVVRGNANALMVGSIEAMAEKLGTLRFFGKAGSEIATKFGQDTYKKLMIEVSKKLAKNSLMEGVEEGVTEIGQSLSNYLIGGDDKALEGVGQRTGQSFLVGAASGGAMGSFTEVLANKQRATQIGKTNTLRNQYSELGKTVAESKLNGRFPEAHEEALASIVKDTPVEHVYLSAEDAQTYFQSKNIDLKELGVELGIENEVNEALETGSDIKIPLAKWAAKLGPTEHYEALKNDIKYSPDDFTVNQNTEFNEDIMKQMVAEDQQVINEALEDVSISEQANSVYNTIKTDLVNRGQDSKMAEQAAELWKSTAVASSARQGISVEEWFQKTRPTIVNGDAQVPLKYERKSIPKFESENIVDDAQVKKAISELGLPESYQNDESISAIRETLAMFQDEINQAEAGKRTFREGEFGGDSIVESIPSTFPKWFRENFKTKKDFLKVVSKGNSKYLAPVIQQAIKALKEGHGENPKNIIAPNLDFVSLVDPESLESSFQINQAMSQGGDLEFNQSKQDVNRGSVQFRKDQTILRLFKDANQSTFLHESAHIFFEDFYNHAMSGDASIKYMKDWQKLSEWLGYKPEQTSLTVDQHEKFARGFETYLMEGDAPSAGLRRVFGQFRKWLTRIYKNVKNLDAELSPDVREIMSRMVATDNEIAIARKQQGLDTELDLSDISETVKSKLDDIKFEAEERAFAKLMKDQMKEISADHKEFLKNKRAELSKAIRKEIEESTEGQLIKNIKSSLRAKDIWATSAKFLDGSMTEQKKLMFNVVAEELGYSSGDHMAREIQELPTIEAQIKERLDSEMKKFSEFTDKEIVREKAKEVIHNEKSVELLGIEREIIRQKLLSETERENNRIIAAMERADTKLILDWLSDKDKKEVFNNKIARINEKHQKQLERLSEREKEVKAREDQKRLLKEFLAAKDDNARKTKIKQYRDSVNSLSRIIAGQTKSEADIVKSTAVAILASKSHVEASQFNRYYVAERNAAIRAAKAISKNDWEGAFKAKQEQMLNHALSRESLSIRKRASRHKKYLNDMRTASRESFKNEDHLFQASKILERFGYTRADYDSNFQGETLAAWELKHNETLGIINIAPWIMDERTRIQTNELTIEQLEDVRNAIQNIKKVDKYEDQLFALNKAETMETLEGKLLQASQQNFDPNNRFKYKLKEEGWDKFKGWMRQYMFPLKKIGTIMGPLDDWRDGGIWTKTFKDSAQDAANNESAMVRDAAKKLEGNWKLYSDKERKDIFNKDIYVKEFGITLKKESLLAMAHNLGNAGNRERLFGTRPVGIDSSIPWGEGIVMQVLQRELSANDWKFIQSNWDLLESFWPKIKALHKEMTGFSPGKIEHMKFSVISNGVKIDLNGGYYPLKQDTRGSTVAEIRELADAPLYTEQNPAWRASTKTGHTKARTGGEYPVSLNLGVMNRHMQDVIHDLAFRPVVTDLRRLTSRPNIQAELKSTLTPEGLREVDTYVKNLAGAAPGEPLNAFEKALKFVRHRTVNAILMLKVSSLTQNFANVLIYPNAAEGFGHKEVLKHYMKQGIGNYAVKLLTRQGDTLRAEVYARSTFMKDRADSPDYTIEEVHNKFSKNEKGTLSRWGGGLMAFTDEFTNIPMWLGAEEEGLKQGKTPEQAARYADMIVERAVGSSRKYDMPSVTRANETAKVFTMFFTFLNTEHNAWMREMGIVNRDKDVPRALGFLAGRMAFLVAGAALMGRLPDLEDEDEVKKFVYTNTVGYPLSFFPILRDVTTIVADQAIGVRGFGYNPSPALASVESLTNFTGSTIALAKGDTDIDEVAEKASKVTALGFGYPDQFNQWFFNLYDYTEGMEPQLKDVFKRRPKKER